MTEKPQSCQAEFDLAKPPGPWTKDTPVSAFKPLTDLIDQHTQSDLFRRVGNKYQSNEDYYDLAKDLDSEGKAVGKNTFANGVTAEVHQADGWPTKLVLEDKAAGLKETVTMNANTHTIETDKVEYCSVSRQRKFSTGGEYYRAYAFPGGSVEKSSGLPVLHLDGK
ncbi:MAG: hypothetical protein JST01_00800 [Cyanobacteria bacterium SZAS TMP-1]|nr:hypothetical protein [Cyanobacteria bacterium SZAS TMP-1]